MTIVFPILCWRERGTSFSIPTSQIWSSWNLWGIPCEIKSHRTKLKGSNEIKQMTLSFCCSKKQNQLPLYRPTALLSILARQKKVMNWDKRCENPHLWYCSCWGFCCSVPCSFEKLHRHKLKTIFNFKITEWVVKRSSSHGGSSVFWFLSQPFLSNLLPKKKCPKRSVWTQCVFGVFWFFGFVLFWF